MKLRTHIALFLALSIGLISLGNAHAPIPVKQELEQVSTNDHEEGNQNEELSASLSLEAVFQVFHFSPKTWLIGFLSYELPRSIPEVSSEFIFRVFKVSFDKFIFEDIIARNAP